MTFTCRRMVRPRLTIYVCQESQQVREPQHEHEDGDGSAGTFFGEGGRGCTWGHTWGGLGSWDHTWGELGFWDHTWGSRVHTWGAQETGMCWQPFPAEHLPTGAQHPMAPPPPEITCASPHISPSPTCPLLTCALACVPTCEHRAHLGSLYTWGSCPLPSGQGAKKCHS